VEPASRVDRIAGHGGPGPQRQFGAIGATAMTKAANLDKIPMGGTLYTFRVQ